MRLSYCTNIHPADSWEKTSAALTEHAPSIKKHLIEMDSLIAGEPLGLGLRLSASAAQTLINSPRSIHEFREWMKRHDCFVETVNGFPYGSFYGERIKENVFKPDWSTEERTEYTKNLACILSELMPHSLRRATISSVPISHRSFLVDEKKVVCHLDNLCQFLDQIEERTEKRIILGLEPEPQGYIDSTQGVIDFFARLKNQSSNPTLIEKHLGITYDTCHFSVMGEAPSSTLSSWERENITVSKIQFSNALELQTQSIDDLDCLAPFVEPVYFHQTSIALKDGKLLLFCDLPEALSWARNHEGDVAESRWRIHYHIPLFAQPSGNLQSTSPCNEETAKWLQQQDVLPQMEVETYTWSVIPDSLKKESISLQIARELDWMASLLIRQGCIEKR